MALSPFCVSSAGFQAHPSGHSVESGGQIARASCLRESVAAFRAFSLHLWIAQGSNHSRSTNAGHIQLQGSWRHLQAHVQSQRPVAAASSALPTVTAR